MVALFGLAFAAPPLSVKLATECKSLTHYTKGTQSPGFKGSRRALKPVARRLLTHARSLFAHVHSLKFDSHPLKTHQLSLLLISFDVSRATRSNIKESR